MAVTVTYSDLVIGFPNPDKLRKKMEKLGAEPRITALTTPEGYDTYDAVLTAELGDKEYEMSDSLLCEERDALDTLSDDGVNHDTSAIEDVERGSDTVYLYFRDIGYDV